MAVELGIKTATYKLRLTVLIKPFLVPAPSVYVSCSSAMSSEGLSSSGVKAGRMACLKQRNR